MLSTISIRPESPFQSWTLIKNPPIPTGLQQDSWVPYLHPQSTPSTQASPTSWDPKYLLQFEFNTLLFIVSPSSSLSLLGNRLHSLISDHLTFYYCAHVSKATQAPKECLCWATRSDLQTVDLITFRKFYPSTNMDNICSKFTEGIFFQLRTRVKSSPRNIPLAPLVAKSSFKLLNDQSVWKSLKDLINPDY